MQEDYAIRVENLKKSFKLPHDKSQSLKTSFINKARKSKKGYEIQNVLKGISFEIKKGDFFGIVGRNGSGKSTLLKCLANIYTPDSGAVSVNGSLTPFIELGVGFNGELTGRENVYLNGALLGFSRQEMTEMYPDIVEFAELDAFMDQKLKNYSSGMQVRLAFSIAIRAQSDILLLDEVLAVGDAAFQQKCYDYFAELKANKRTIILVTHSMDTVLRFCNKAILIDDGIIKEKGSPESVTKEYEFINKKQIQSQEKTTSNKDNKLLNRENNKFIVNANAVDSFGNTTDSYIGEEFINLKVEITPKETISDAFIGFTLHKAGGEYVFWTTTETEGHKVKVLKKGKKYKYDIVIQNVFGDNTYFFNVVIRKNDRTVEYIDAHEIVKFVINQQMKNGWMLHPSYKVIKR